MRQEKEEEDEKDAGFSASFDIFISEAFYLV